MKLKFFAILLMAVPGWTSSKGSGDPAKNNYYHLNAPTVVELQTSAADLETLRSAENFGDCNRTAVQSIDDMEDPSIDEPSNPDNPLDPINQAEIIVDKIINIGKKIWAIVEAGRPVVNVKVDTANALPKGIMCWADLAGWTPTQAKTYQVVYTNGFGSKVVDFTFRVLYTVGGNYKGIGRYITNATIFPSKLNVAWGFKFDAASEVPTVMNTGTSQNPLAGMNLNVNWKVTSVMSHAEQTESFFIGGDGNFLKLP